MSWPNSEGELKRILERSPAPFNNMFDLGEDAKGRLHAARLHSPIVSAVWTSVRYAERYEKVPIGDGNLYAIMALELLRAHEAQTKHLLALHSSQISPRIMMVSECTLRHLVPKNWWQRFCLKAAGL